MNLLRRVSLGAFQGRGATAFLVTNETAIGENKDSGEFFFVDIPFAGKVRLQAAGGEEADGTIAQSTKIKPKFPRTAVENRGLRLSSKHVDNFLLRGEVYAANFAGSFHIGSESQGNVPVSADLFVFGHQV